MAGTTTIWVMFRSSAGRTVEVVATTLLVAPVVVVTTRPLTFSTSLVGAITLGGFGVRTCSLACAAEFTVVLATSPFTPRSPRRPPVDRPPPKPPPPMPPPNPPPKPPPSPPPICWAWPGAARTSARASTVVVVRALIIVRLHPVRRRRFKNRLLVRETHGGRDLIHEPGNFGRIFSNAFAAGVAQDAATRARAWRNRLMVGAFEHVAGVVSIAQRRQA